MRWDGGNDALALDVWGANGKRTLVANAVNATQQLPHVKNFATARDSAYLSCIQLLLVLIV